MNTRRSIVLYKQESVAGTAEKGLTGADNGGYNIYDFKFTPDNNVTELPAQASTGILGTVDGVQGCTYSFKTDLDGDPADAGAVPTWADFLLIGGFTASDGTYSWTDVLASQKTGTFFYCTDGRLDTIFGAAHSGKIVVKNGERGYIEWNGKAKYTSESTASLPTGFTFPDVVGMPRGLSTLTIASFAPQTENLTYDIGGIVTMLPSVLDPSGLAYGCIPGRRTTLQMDPAAITSQNWNTLKTAGTGQALSMVVGATGRCITIASSAMYVRERQQPGDREGIVTDPVMLVQGDAVVIAFS